MTHRQNTLTEKIAMELCMIANEDHGPPPSMDRAWGIAEFMREAYRVKARRLIRIVQSHSERSRTDLLAEVEETNDAD